MSIGPGNTQKCVIFHRGGVGWIAYIGSTISYTEIYIDELNSLRIFFLLKLY